MIVWISVYKEQITTLSLIRRKVSRNYHLLIWCIEPNPLYLQLYTSTSFSLPPLPSSLHHPLTCPTVICLVGVPAPDRWIIWKYSSKQEEAWGGFNSVELSRTSGIFHVVCIFFAHCMCVSFGSLLLNCTLIKETRRWTGLMDHINLQLSGDATHDFHHR